MYKDGFLTVDYEEFKAETFKGFILILPNKEKIRFEGKTAISAYKKYLKYLNQHYPLRVIHSSQVDNYLMDSDDKKLAKLIYN